MEYKTEKANRESNFGEPAWYGLWRKGADDYWHYARTQYGINYTTEAHALAGAKVCAEEAARFRKAPGGFILNNEKEEDEARLQRAWDRARSSTD